MNRDNVLLLKIVWWSEKRVECVGCMCAQQGLLLNSLARKRYCANPHSNLVNSVFDADNWFGCMLWNVSVCCSLCRYVFHRVCCGMLCNVLVWRVEWGLASYILRKRLFKNKSWWAHRLPTHSTRSSDHQTISNNNTLSLFTFFLSLYQQTLSVYRKSDVIVDCVHKRGDRWDESGMGIGIVPPPREVV